MPKKTKAPETQEPEFVVEGEETEKIQSKPTRPARKRRLTPEERETREAQRSERRRQKEEKKNKPKRAPSAYALYVKSKYDSVRDLPVKERLGAIGKMWKAEKAKAEKK